MTLPPAPPGGLKGLLYLVLLCVAIGSIGVWAIIELIRELRGGK